MLNCIHITLIDVKCQSQLAKLKCNIDGNVIWLIEAMQSQQAYQNGPANQRPPSKECQMAFALSTIIELVFLYLLIFRLVQMCLNMEWTNDQVIDLIEICRCNEIPQNRNLPEYHNKMKRRSAFMDMVNYFNIKNSKD